MIGSALFAGSVMHERLRPKRHRFQYRVFSLLLDLDGIPALDRRLALFARNRPALFSFYDEDHGDGERGGLRDWAERRLAEAGLDLRGGSIAILCYPRIFGYVFNPLTVFFCYSPEGALGAILYEVANTHGERHTYVARVESSAGGVARQSCKKNFFVSPFIGMECRYDFRVVLPAEKVVVAICDSDAEGPLLSAVFSGRRKPLSDKELLKAFFAYPLMTLKVIAAIHWEAFRLLRKGVPMHSHARAGTPAENGLNLTAPPRHEIDDARASSAGSLSGPNAW